MARASFWLALWLATCSAFPLSSSTATSTNETAPIVDLGYAQYQGSFDAQTNLTSFLGVRFAAPPVGNLRFQAPQPPDYESGVQLATRNPDTCLQAGYSIPLPQTFLWIGYDEPPQNTPPAASEDCLFLNAFVPGPIPETPVASGGLPVVVWIHGGVFQVMSAASFNGAALVADSLNTAIVVVIQYRLGAFGFLPGNEVKAQGALNAGLLDQQFALEWVQDHIASFGGDKNRVTIWGQSSGATSVLQHIIANGGNTSPPLFENAMSSSPSVPPQYYYNDPIPQSLYDQIVNMTGCASSANTFECLQSTEVDTLQDVNHHIATSAFYGLPAFGPVVDGTFIVERPTVALSKGLVNGRILLAFNNQNEGLIFVNENETLTTVEYISRVFPLMTPEEVERAAAMYQDYGTTAEQVIVLLGDAMFVCITHALLGAFAGRSWKGRFAIPPGYHGEDVPEYFYGATDPPAYNNSEFLAAFSQSFMSLAEFGDVNVKFDPTNITPNWDMYNVGDTEMLFNRTESGEPVVVPIHTDPAQLERCEFWASVTASTSQ